MVRAKDLDMVAPDDVIPAKETVMEAKPITNEKVDQFKDKIYDLLGHTKYPWSALLVKPKVFKFIEQGDQEEIILVMRPHWFTNVSWVITTIFMLMVPNLVKFIPMWGAVAFRYQFLGVLFWYMITLAFALEKFLSWYFDVFIVTNERVIDIEFNNLLDKKFSEAGIEMIQDVTSRVAGISQTLFNYGDVLIQTAAEISELTFEKVPNPDKVIKVLQLLKQEEEHHVA